MGRWVGTAWQLSEMAAATHRRCFAFVSYENPFTFQRPPLQVVQLQLPSLSAGPPPSNCSCSMPS